MKKLIFMMALICASFSRAQDVDQVFSQLQNEYNFPYPSPFYVTNTPSLLIGFDVGTVNAFNFGLGYQENLTGAEEVAFGIANTMSGVGSGVFGEFNNDGGFNYALMFGRGITATATNTAYFGSTAYPENLNITGNLTLTGNISGSGSLLTGIPWTAEANNTINSVAGWNAAGTPVAFTSLPLYFVYVNKWVTNAYTVTTNDTVLFCWGTNETLTLPTVALPGKMFTILCKNPNGSVIVTNGNGAQTILQPGVGDGLSAGIGPSTSALNAITVTFDGNNY